MWSIISETSKTRSCLALRKTGTLNIMYGVLKIVSLNSNVSNQHVLQVRDKRDKNWRFCLAVDNVTTACVTGSTIREIKTEVLLSCG